MIETNDTPNLLQEYVLDLLPVPEKQQVAQHIGADALLLEQVKQERRVSQLVKQTLHQAGQIENGRLAQLMPAIPKQKQLFWPSFALRQLAVVAMLFVLLLGGWQWFNHDQSAIWPSTPTIVAVTATTTHAPTATETQIGPTETAVANPNESAIVITPAPPPTPVAAVPVNTN
jgi:anti-sigma factor RsiW